MLPPPVSTTTAPADELLELYGRYLIEDRDLGPSTVPEYLSLARRFLRKCLPATAGVTALAGLRGADVTTFLLAEVAPLRGGTPAKRVTQLRSFLRFLRLHGLIASDLAAAVPPAANWREARLPRTVTPAQITAILASCDRAQGTGRRDFAILRLLTRLGLRAVDVTDGGTYPRFPDGIDPRRGAKGGRRTACGALAGERRAR